MFAGSNLTSLQQGLRSGTTVTLTGAGETATFTPPTGHMGNGEVERALTLASRDLADAGITNPTPQQLEAALMGGTVTNAQGETTTMPGVLVLRGQGMGWGQIAHAIGVHPSQSPQGAANARGSIGEGGILARNRSDRSAALARSDSDRNRLSLESRANAISSSSATAAVNAPANSSHSTNVQPSRGAESARSGTQLSGGLAAAGGDHARSARGKERPGASMTSTNGRAKAHPHANAAAAGVLNTGGIFNGPAHAAPGRAIPGKGTPATAGDPPAGGNFAAAVGASVASSNAGGDLAGGPGGGKGHGKGK